MKGTFKPKLLMPMQSIEFAMLLVMSASTLFASSGKTACGGTTVEIRRDNLRIALDSQFPRVLSYEVKGRGRLLGAREDSEALIKLNERTFSAGDYTVSCTADDSAADYTLTITPVQVRLVFRFEVHPNELSLKLTSVEEHGAFKLITLSFPDHELVRVTASNSTSSMYRSQYHRYPWKENGYKAGYDQPAPFFSSTIGEEDGELYPMLGNWVSASADGITATLATNIPYWKIRSQFLGYDAKATDFAFWLGPYYYRLRGAVQPLLEARIALLTEDVNGDGLVDWMEAALWHHDLIQEPSPVFDPSTTFSYKVMNDWIDQPGNEPSTTFEETLQLIKRISRITGNSKQVPALTGWQNRGMDSGWPYFDHVNDALGGLAKLQWLASEAKKYNATISYHINIDDSNADTPGFDRSIPVLADGHDGKPYPWAIYYTDGPQVYRISHTKDFESGFFAQRVGAMLRRVPKTNSIQLDTFRPYNVSFGPGDNIGLVDEVVSSARIVEWFHQHGIAISSEGPVDALYGVLDANYHLSARTDPFHILMTHGKVYGGGEYSGMGQVLGWAPDHDFVARPLEWKVPKFDIDIRWTPPTDDDLRDMYYLGTLTQGYLMRKRLVWLGEEPNKELPAPDATKKDRPKPTYLGRFADGTVSKVSSTGQWTVVDQGITTVEDDYRAISLGDTGIVLYSVKSRTAEVRIPDKWRKKKLVLTEVETGKSRLVAPTADASSVVVELPSRTAYRLQISQ